MLRHPAPFVCGLGRDPDANEPGTRKAPDASIRGLPVIGRSVDPMDQLVRSMVLPATYL